jgi:hypothetical protein
VIEEILTCGSKTQKNTHVSKVGGRKESIRLINDNLKQNNRRGGNHSPVLWHGKNTMCRVRILWTE